MTLKLIAAGMIAALLAGAAVYFGADTADLGATETPANVEAPDDAIENEAEPSVDQTEPSGAEVTPPTDEVPDERDVEDASAEAARPVTSIDVLMDQADQITIISVKDDAYLNILDYALAQDRIAVADEVIAQLSSPDLRDLGRRSVALTHAQMGRTEDAFAVIDRLEIGELKDPIRLEVIRALATLPSGG